MSNRTFVAPSDDSLRAAMQLAGPDEAKGMWMMPYDVLRTAQGAGAYPGTMPVYASVPTIGLPAEDALHLAQFLRFAAAEGQLPGLENGQLPPGYLPLTAANGFADLVAFTLRAATAVAAQDGELPALMPAAIPSSSASASSSGSSGSSGLSGSSAGTTSSLDRGQRGRRERGWCPHAWSDPDSRGDRLAERLLDPRGRPAGHHRCLVLVDGWLGAADPAADRVGLRARRRTDPRRLLGRPPAASVAMRAAGTRTRAAGTLVRATETLRRHRAGRDDVRVDRLSASDVVRPGSTAPPRRRADSEPLPLGVAIAVRACLTCALLAAAMVGYLLWVSALPQARSQEQLYGQLREQLALATAPVGGAIEPGVPVALIEAPSIGLRQVMVEGTASDQMRHGPGHRRDTPLPGQPGAAVVYGHSVAYGGPFGSIVWLLPGDIITVTTGQGPFTYQVTGVRRAKDPLPPPLQAGHSRLILVTAEGDGWRHDWAPDHVVYVDAAMSGDTVLGPAGRPASIPTSEKAMQGDPDAFIPLVLWLQLLGASAAAATWARIRWGGIQTWVVGVPVLLVGVWGAMDSAAQLLPNLL